MITEPGWRPVEEDTPSIANSGYKPTKWAIFGYKWLFLRKSTWFLINEFFIKNIVKRAFLRDNSTFSKQKGSKMANVFLVINKNGGGVVPGLSKTIVENIQFNFFSSFSRSCILFPVFWSGKIPARFQYNGTVL